MKDQVFTHDDEPESEMREMFKDIAAEQGGIEFVENTSDIKSICFSCIGCGKCCDTPPSMTIRELLRQSRNFIIGAELRSEGNVDLSHDADRAMLAATYSEFDLPERLDTLERLAQYTNRRGERMGIPIAQTATCGSSASVFVSFTDVDRDSGKCPALQLDGSCGIYETRPRKCRIVPFDESIPEEDAGNALAVNLGKMLTFGAECRTDAEAPVVWKDGAFADDDMKSLCDGMRFGESETVAEANRAIAEEYISFTSESADKPRAEIELAIEFMTERGTTPISDLVPGLFRLAADGYIRFDTAMAILRNQIDLIEERLPFIPDDRIMLGKVGASMVTILAGWAGIYRDVIDAWTLDEEPDDDRNAPPA